MNQKNRVLKTARKNNGRPLLRLLEAGKDFLKYKRQRKHKVKRQATEQDRISTIQIIDKELMPRIFKLQQ